MGGDGLVSPVSAIAASRIRCSRCRRCSRWRSASSCRWPCLLSIRSGRPKTGEIVHRWTMGNYIRFFTQPAYLADAASLVLAGLACVRVHGVAQLPLRLFRGSQGQAVAAAGLDSDRDHSLLDQLSDPRSCLAQHVRRRGADQQGADRPRPGRFAGRILRLRQAGDRDHLRLSAVPALLPRDLYRHRADQPGDAGCCRRSRRQAVAEAGHDNAADGPLRHRGRFRLRLHRA